MGGAALIYPAALQGIPGELHVLLPDRGVGPVESGCSG